MGIRQYKRPLLSDLRETGQIEQDADLIMLMYGEDYYDKDTEKKDITEIRVAKHRNGPCWDDESEVFEGVWEVCGEGRVEMFFESFKKEKG